jgi:hypothetical protein
MTPMTPTHKIKYPKWEHIHERDAEIERLKRYPEAVEQIRREWKPGRVVTEDWKVLCRVLKRIEDIVEKGARDE